ncbi:hypothetical protein EfmAA290_18180 [Enterococcus faecium]|nr:hypothetical protein EfmAA290_18180 [Enterococcus faecium]
MEKAFKNKPLYCQLSDLLKERIEVSMIPHDKVPSERELTAQYNNKRIKLKLNGLSPVEYRKQSIK